MRPRRHREFPDFFPAGQAARSVAAWAAIGASRSGREAVLRRLLKAMGVATALALAAPGCGGGDSDKKPAQVANEKSATPRVTTSKPAPALDACKLLTQAEVQPYLGVTEAGRPAAGRGGERLRMAERQHRGVRHPQHRQQ